MLHIIIYICVCERQCPPVLGILDVKNLKFLRKVVKISLTFEPSRVYLEMQGSTTCV